MYMSTVTDRVCLLQRLAQYTQQHAVQRLLLLLLELRLVQLQLLLGLKLLLLLLLLLRLLLLLLLLRLLHAVDKVELARLLLVI